MFRNGEDALLLYGRQGYPSGKHAHYTCLLGEVVPQRLSAAKDAMDDVTAEPFSAEIGGIGCFHRSGGDIYWAGVERSLPLCALYSALCHSLREHGFKVDSALQAAPDAYAAGAAER